MDFDVIVIGSGPGGYVAAVRCAQLGLKTACIEKNSTLGGTCLNVGCIPSKTLLQSSEEYAWITKKAAESGINVTQASYDFSKMMKRKDEIVKGLVDSVASLFKRHNIERINGAATFIGANEVEVSGKKYTAKNFILATGSEPIQLPFLPFNEKTIISSTGALSLPKVPESLAVIGGGVIGVELASVYNRLGSKVTVIEMMDTLCPGMDKTITKALLQSLKKQGIEFQLGAQVKSAQGTRLNLGDKSLDANIVLVAVGRRPYSKGLGLEKIGIDKIEVDSCFRTKHPHIFAIGDLIPGPMLAHRAMEEGIAVAEFIAGKKPLVNYMTIPNVVYTHPEVATVGYTEEEAKGMELLIGTAYFKGNARARCAGDTDGLVKVIGEKNSGRLIGLHIIGPHASEMIGEGVAAIEKKMKVNELAHMVHAHPTLTEAIKEAAEAAAGWPIHG